MLEIFKCIQFVFPVERDKNFLLDVKKKIWDDEANLFLFHQEHQKLVWIWWRLLSTIYNQKVVKIDI